jgi:hypothetical protein
LTRCRLLFATLVCVLVATPLLAQRVLPLSADAPLTPRAIAGTPSSALHCVAANGVNLHSLGWIDAGSNYTVTFDTTLTLSTSISRLNLAEQTATLAQGNPDFSFTAGSAGTMVLHVAAIGQAGCYRYKAEIGPMGNAVPVSPLAALPTLAKPAKQSFETSAIAGLASSGQHCVAGDHVANAHDIGRVDTPSVVTITFASDFDAIAGVTMTNVEGRTGSFAIDDDGGGNLEPGISVDVEPAETVTLFVTGVGGAAGCYRYKVEVR